MILKAWSTSLISRCHQKFTTFLYPIGKELEVVLIPQGSILNFHRSKLVPQISGSKVLVSLRLRETGRLSKTSRLGKIHQKERDKITHLQDRGSIITRPTKFKVHLAVRTKMECFRMKACLRPSSSFTKHSLQIESFISLNLVSSITIIRMKR